MKKTNSIIWGVVLVLVGVVIALNAFNITNIDLFFDGWWTLIIIVPCVVGLFTEREKLGNIIGIVVGVLLLLCCWDIINFDFIWKLILPVVIVIIGAKLVINGFRGNKSAEMLNEMKEKGKDVKNGFAAFSGSELNFDGEIFEGAELNAIFGAVECDLRNAVIPRDCAIQVSAIFGGVDILVPDTVNVKVNSTSIFGGISNKSKSKKDGVTLYINGTCLFGGVEIK